MKSKTFLRSGMVVLLVVSFFGVVSSAKAAPNEAAIGGPKDDDGQQVLIGFRRAPGQAEEAIVRAAGGEVRYSYRLIPAIAAWIPAQALDGLSHNPNVTVIEPDVEAHAVDAELDNAWGVKKIGAGLAHDAGKFGTGVKVAVIDTGIDYNHPDLNANFAGGYDFVNDDNDPMDDNDHGTHVAGTIAAEDDGAGVVGVAPQARLYALKVLNAAGSGYFSDIIAALEWCVNNGIQVTNNSYGSSQNPGTLVQAAFDNAESVGIVNVAAAGNSGNLRGKGDNVIYPARYASVIAVAATDSNNKRASFSSTGSAVELSGPGVAVNSCKRGGGYVIFSGTSMACPHVVGTAALVLGAGIADANGNGRVNDEVRSRMNLTADDLGKVGRDTLYGYGLVDADEAAGP